MISKSAATLIDHWSLISKCFNLTKPSKEGEKAEQQHRQTSSWTRFPFPKLLQITTWLGFFSLPLSFDRSLIYFRVFWPPAVFPLDIHFKTHSSLILFPMWVICNFLQLLQPSPQFHLHSFPNTSSRQLELLILNFSSENFSFQKPKLLKCMFSMFS